MVGSAAKFVSVVFKGTVANALLSIQDMLWRRLTITQYPSCALSLTHTVSLPAKHIPYPYSFHQHILVGERSFEDHYMLTLCASHNFFLTDKGGCNILRTSFTRNYRYELYVKSLYFRLYFVNCLYFDETSGDVSSKKADHIFQDG